MVPLLSGLAGCEDPRMRMTTPCVSSGNGGQRPCWESFPECTRARAHTPLTPNPCLPWAGSLWDPNITAETLEAQQLRLSFTLWNESTPYQILLTSFPHTKNQSCFHHGLMVSTVRRHRPERECQGVKPPSTVVDPRSAPLGSCLSF